MALFFVTICGMSRILFTLFSYLLLSVPVAAQDAKQILLKNIFVDAPLVLSGVNSEGGINAVTLWGVDNIPVGDSLAARLALEDIVGETPVNCTVKEWTSPQTALAQCIGIQENDLALSLIEQGYAMADRRIVQGTVFEDIYKSSEDTARRNRRGAWASLSAGGNVESLIEANNTTPFKMTEDVAYFAIAAMILGPFIGMLIVAVIIYGGFRRLISLQKYQIAMNNKKDRTMREREKFIVAASLEGELNTNRAKLDAFIIIYEEMLKNLRDPLKDHKYKKGGDIIHEKPALSRNVYDSNIDKLDLLGPTIVADLTRLYTMIEPNPNYKTIEPDTPIDDVIDFVNDIVHDAEAMLNPMDNISGALNVIVRDKRAKASEQIV